MPRHSRHEQHRCYKRYQRHDAPVVVPPVTPSVTKKADVTGKAVNNVVNTSDLFTFKDGALKDFAITADNTATVAADGSTVTVRKTGVTTVAAKPKTDTNPQATATITAS